MENTITTQTLKTRIETIQNSNEDWRIYSQVSNETLLVRPSMLPTGMLSAFLSRHDNDSRTTVYINKACQYVVVCGETDQEIVIND